ncbi:MAG: peptide chain release factor N(5)-glutamine methyltransferase [Saprospiraceae bacterium]|nr:peptide chain release factor N(5)-glutamine methyltransferase [Saprospiraceae bacterium]
MLSELELRNIFFEVLEKDFDSRTIEQWLRIYDEDKDWDKSISQPHRHEIIESDLLRIKNGEPIQYVVGKAYFYDRLFNVNPDVLIPRPETEELVSLVLKNHKRENQLSVLDVGTGSGCIAVVLKDRLNLATVYALDKSEEAIQVAKSNAGKYDVDVSFLELDFLNEGNWDLLPVVDIIVSNPPYIQCEEKRMMTDSVLKYEPISALIPDHPDPLVFYRRLAAIGLKLFKGKGRIYVEINEFLGPETFRVFINAGYEAQLHQDIQGKNRMIRASIDTLK